jgi:hypothetical protein
VTRGATSPALTTVIRDGRVDGFLLSRGPMGVEAFDADERSLGIFADAGLAHAAIVAETQGAVAVDLADMPRVK